VRYRSVVVRLRSWSRLSPSPQLVGPALCLGQCLKRRLKSAVCFPLFDGSKSVSHILTVMRRYIARSGRPTRHRICNAGAGFMILRFFRKVPTKVPAKYLRFRRLIVRIHGVLTTVIGRQCGGANRLCGSL
jgi:hypothetical protein